MSIRRVLTAITFLLAWAVVAFALMPIKLMIDQWGAPFGMDVRDPGGTLWNGQAQVRAHLAPDTPAVSTAVTWEWCPSWRRGLLSACVEAENEIADGSGFVYYSLPRARLGMEEAAVKVKFGSRFNELLQLPVAVSGVGDIRVASLLMDWRKRLPDSISARGKLSRMSAGEIELGDYLLRVDTIDEQHVDANIKGGNDAFQVKAQARLSLASRKYSYEAELRSEHTEVQNVIRPFARSSGKNTYSISGEHVVP